MFYVTAIPTAGSRQLQLQQIQMLKTTFVCHPCNRTWTYVLAAEFSAQYAEEYPFELPVI